MASFAPIQYAELFVDNFFLPLISSSPQMSVHIFMEYMDAGSLADLIKRMSVPPCCSLSPLALFPRPHQVDVEVPDQVTFHVAKSVVLGLKFLQEELKTVHRDIKPSNVLVNRNAQVKICDFSISKQLARTAGDTYVGTMHYMAVSCGVQENLSCSPSSTVLPVPIA